MSENEPIKNFINVDYARALGLRIRAVHPNFPLEPFVAQVAAEVDALEFKARIALIVTALRAHLPSDYAATLEIFAGMLPPPLADDDPVYSNGFLMPLSQYVGEYGLDHVDESLAALYAITQRNSCELAIRPFIIHHPARTLPALDSWTGDPSAHVRRLVTEGSRPRLPWAPQIKAFIADPTPALALLDKIRVDPVETVRRSIANHLNDIAKDHPARVIETLARWQVATGTDSADLTWMTQRALRTLVKQGDPAALALLGYGTPRVSLVDLALTPDRIPIGEGIEISFTLRSQSDQPQELVVDYVVHLVRQRGKTSPKVFKLKTLTLSPGADVPVRKRLSMAPSTVRRYYPGEHRVDIQVNGRVFDTAVFDLTE